MSPNQTDKDYVAGQLGYVYPELGEALPPGGAKVLLLTAGGVCVSGAWSNDGRYLAWSPMPRRSDYVYPTADGQNRPGKSGLLLLTSGGICVVGSWTHDGRYQGWTRPPKRCQAKEDAIMARRAPATWLLAA